MQLHGLGTLNDGATALVNCVLPGDGRTGFCGSGRGGGYREKMPEGMIGEARTESFGAL